MSITDFGFTQQKAVSSAPHNAKQLQPHASASADSKKHAKPEAVIDLSSSSVTKASPASPAPVSPTLREEILSKFDMNMSYGPCRGMSRRARWERAQKLKLDPPAEVLRMLQQAEAEERCLWDRNSPSPSV